MPDEASRRQPSAEEAMEALEFYRNQLGAMSRQSDVLAAAIKEHEKALTTIDGVSSLGSGDSEMLVPIGAGAFLFCKLVDRENAMLGLGSNISARMKLQDSRKILHERKVELESALEKLNKDIQKLEKQVAGLEQYTNGLCSPKGQAGHGSDGGCSSCEDDCSSCHDN